MLRSFALALILFASTTSLAAAPFLCASLEEGPQPTAKAAQPTDRSTRNAMALFAHFRDKPPSQPAIPAWSAELFDLDRPGSFSHFYRTMSFDRHNVVGTVAPIRFASEHNAASYLSQDSEERGNFGRFSLEVLGRADEIVDFSQFDNDGPDGVPNSGDDDAYVDAVFVILPSVPRDFLLRSATGIASLGFEDDFLTNDSGIDGAPIRISPDQGTIQQGRTFSETVGVMCHEYGHLLGLPDLFNLAFLRTDSAGPEEDSAGIGAWGLMGWGTLGWNGDDGPNAFSAWSRMHLGWAQVRSVAQSQEDLRLPQVGIQGDLFRIPVDENEYYLLEHRRRISSYYDRSIPGEGVLIWHVKEAPGAPVLSVSVDLECADGLWRDAGFPVGTEPDPASGADNLDFWAHDAAYAKAHAGNLGDSTDPFGGGGRWDFSPTTNPGSVSIQGRCCASVEDIRLDGELAHARVTTEPLHLDLANLHLQEENDDGLLVVGEEAWVFFSLHNAGGIDADVRVVLSAVDERLVMVEPELALSVGVGAWELTSHRTGFLRFRLADLDLPVEELQVDLDLYVNDVWQESRPIPFRAVATSTWSGIVTDPGGQGIPDVKISVGSYPTETASDGTFTIDVPAGTYNVSVEPPPSAEAGYESLTVDLTEDEQTEVVLPALVALTGHVIGADGTPIEAIMQGILVSRGRFYSTTSDDSGQYDLPLPRGLYDILVIPQSGAVMTGPVLSDVLVEESGFLDIQLDPGVPIRLNVFDDTGLGTRSFFNLVGHASRGFFPTDSEGLAQVRVLPDVYWIQELSTSQVQARVVDPTEVAEFTFSSPKPVVVTGTLTSELKESFTREVILFGATGAIVRDQSFGIELTPGGYEVSFRGTDGPRERLQTVDTLTFETDAELQFELDGQDFVGGQLLDEDFAALRLMNVRARSSSAGVFSQVPVGADGGFGFFLRPGVYEFSATDGVAHWHLGGASIRGGEAQEFRRPAGAVLRGRVTTKQGLGLEEALVGVTRNMSDFIAPGTIFEHSAGFLAATRTGFDGRYELSALPGTYALIVIPPTQAFSNSTTRSLGHVLPDFRLTGSIEYNAVLPSVDTLHLVHGWIRRASDEPPATVRVQFYEPETGIIASDRDQGRGGYFLGLPVGEYEMRVGVESAVGGFDSVYRVGQLVVDGDVRRDIDLTGATAVAETANAVPDYYRLSQNYPNPFNPSTIIRYELAAAGPITLDVYNLIGQRVATMADQRQQAGSHTVTWDGVDDSGRPLASGVYLYRLRAGSFTQVRKLVLLK